MDFLPDKRLLLTEKTSTLSIFSPQDWQRQPITNVPVSAEAGQGGLMDVLVHPDFADNGWLYLSYAINLDGLYIICVSCLAGGRK